MSKSSVHVRSFFLDLRKKFGISGARAVRKTVKTLGSTILHVAQLTKFNFVYALLLNPLIIVRSKTSTVLLTSLGIIYSYQSSVLELPLGISIQQASIVNSLLGVLFALCHQRRKDLTERTYYYL